MKCRACGEKLKRGVEYCVRCDLPVDESAAAGETFLARIIHLGNSVAWVFSIRRYSIVSPRRSKKKPHLINYFTMPHQQPGNTEKKTKFLTAPLAHL